MKSWLKGGIVVGVLVEVIWFFFTYQISANLPPNTAALFPFPPDLLSVLVIFLVGFAVGAIIGRLLEKR